MSTYEYYLSEDPVEQITLNSFETFLNNVIENNLKVSGGKDWFTTLQRMIYQLLSNIYDMFYHQPIMTICLFGVPMAFFSVIAYSVCSADFLVEHEDIYPIDKDDEKEEEDSKGDDNSIIDENEGDILNREEENLNYGKIFTII